MEKNAVVLYITEDDPLLVCADEWYLPCFGDEAIDKFRHLYSAHFKDRIILKILRSELVFG